MNVLDMFSGIGGFSLGLERAGMKTVAFCEIETFCQKVLKKHWPTVPIFEDVRKLHAKDINEPIDLICGGYPCQPFSLAGKRRGTEDDRHLWPEYLRLIREIRPAWVIAENVAGHINMGLDEVLSGLEGEDYQIWTFIIPACGVDAPHRRDRLWIVANSKCNGLSSTKVTGSLKKTIREKQEGTETHSTLREQVVYDPPEKLWPTPSVCGNYNRKGASKSSGDGLATRVKMFPTPQASDGAKWNNMTAAERKAKGQFVRPGNALSTEENRVGGQLNPTWVEWLMGYPTGWTDLKDSETQ